MAFKLDVRFTGQGQVSRRLSAAWQRYSDLAGKSLYQEAQAVLQLARVLAPIRTGFLRRSGRVVRLPLASGRGHTMLITFTAPYALVVHETHPTRAKFLEQAYRMLAIGMRERLASSIRRGAR